MSLYIVNPETSNTEVRTSLGGIDYTFLYDYSIREKRWYISIYEGDDVLVESVKVVENIDLLSQYNLERFNHGSIWCLRLKKTDRLVEYDNLGVDKEYSLVYFTNAELEG